MEKHYKLIAREQGMMRHTAWRNMAWQHIARRCGVRAAATIAAKMPISFDVQPEPHLAHYVVSHFVTHIRYLIHTN